MANNIERHGCLNLISDCVAYNGLLFLSGIVASDYQNSCFTPQCEEVFSKIEQQLSHENSDVSNIIMATVYLKSFEYFPEFNRNWAKWIAPEAKPARTTVAAELSKSSYLLEISIVAAAHRRPEVGSS